MAKALDDFICKQCGECCRHIDQVEELKHLQVNGVCKYLKDNLCTIYENRPDACNRYKLYKRFQSCMTEETFVNIAQKYCDYYFQLSKTQGKKN